VGDDPQDLLARRGRALCRRLRDAIFDRERRARRHAREEILVLLRKVLGRERAHVHDADDAFGLVHDGHSEENLHASLADDRALDDVARRRRSEQHRLLGRGDRPCEAFADFHREAFVEELLLEADRRADAKDVTVAEENRRRLHGRHGHLEHAEEPLEQIGKRRAQERRGRDAVERLKRAIAEVKVMLDRFGDGAVDHTMKTARCDEADLLLPERHDAIAEQCVLRDHLAEREPLDHAQARVLARLGLGRHRARLERALADFRDALEQLRDVIDELRISQESRALGRTRLRLPGGDDVTLALANELAELDRHARVGAKTEHAERDRSADDEGATPRPTRKSVHSAFSAGVP
jgi:hypothetical protein